MEKQVKLSTPWATHERKLKALFAKDPEVHVEGVFTDEEKHIDIRVDSPAKGEALALLLPEEVDFGGVKVAINVVPANKATVASLLKTAFAGSPALEDVSELPGVFDTNTLTYAEFAPTVVQYWNDDLSSPHGVTTTLFQDLAKDLLTGVAGREAVYATTVAQTITKG